jgi:hypothetical protein
MINKETMILSELLVTGLADLYIVQYISKTEILFFLICDVGYEDLVLMQSELKCTTTPTNSYQQQTASFPAIPLLSLRNFA